MTVSNKIIYDFNESYTSASQCIYYSPLVAGSMAQQALRDACIDLGLRTAPLFSTQGLVGS